jgi:hypothetical protein
MSAIPAGADHVPFVPFLPKPQIILGGFGTIGPIGTGSQPVLAQALLPGSRWL